MRRACVHPGSGGEEQSKGRNRVNGRALTQRRGTVEDDSLREGEGGASGRGGRCGRGRRRSRERDSRGYSWVVYIAETTGLGFPASVMFSLIWVLARSPEMFCLKPKHYTVYVERQNFIP